MGVSIVPLVKIVIVKEFVIMMAAELKIIHLKKIKERMSSVWV